MRAFHVHGFALPHGCFQDLDHMAVLGGLVIHVDYAKQTNADAVVRKLVRPSDSEGMCAEPARSDRPRYDNQLTAINS